MKQTNKHEEKKEKGKSLAAYGETVQEQML